MKISGAIFILQFALGHALVLPSLPQLPLWLDAGDNEPKPDPNSPKSIAIIGSGITGSTAAFNVFELFRLTPNEQPTITIFERNPIIGGRLTSAQVYNDPRLTIDTCAATFSPQDQCIASTAGQVGLTPVSSPLQPEGTGVWDGEKFRGFVEDDSFRNPAGWSFYKKLRYYRRYGDAPWRLNAAVSDARLRFTQLLNVAVAQPNQVQPVRNLARTVKKMGLDEVVTQDVCSSGRLNCANSSDAKFLSEVVEAGARERFFQDYGQVNTLDTLFGYETQMPISIQGGNIRLLDRLIKLSGANLRLGATVTQVLEEPGAGWQIYYTEDGPKGPVKDTLLFDRVIIAAPFGTTDLKIDSAITDKPGLDLKYKDSFVTHFTTPKSLNGSFFGKDAMPQNVLTTAINATSPPPFFSLTLVGRLQNMKEKRMEALYKIVSERMITDEELGMYVEQDVSDPTTPVITWIDRQPLPLSVPFAEPNQTLLQDFEIAPGLIYAGGGEQIAATAEFGCRLGTNAARLAAAT